MAKGISGEEACKKAKSFVRQEYGDLIELQCSKTEKRDKTWVVIIEGGLPPMDREFKVHVDVETGKIGFNKEVKPEL